MAINFWYNFHAACLSFGRSFKGVKVSNKAFSFLFPFLFFSKTYKNEGWNNCKSSFEIDPVRNSV